MNRVVRSCAAKSLRGRQFSSVAVENPRFTIAKNILTYNNIKAATNEAELDAAIKSSPAVDPEALPESIANMKEYLTAAPEAGGEGFKADPTAWQNMDFASYVGVEATRDMTWPFLVGGILTFLMLGVGIPMSLGKEGKKSSKYISMLEGRHGKLEGEGH